MKLAEEQRLIEKWVSDEEQGRRKEEPHNTVLEEGGHEDLATANQ